MNGDLQPSGPSGVPQITVRPRANTSATQAQPESDPWAGSLADPQAVQSAPDTSDPWAGALSDTPPTKSETARTVSRSEAAGAGALDALTFGAAPAMAGAAGASIAAMPTTGPLSPNLDYLAPSVDPGAAAGPGIAGAFNALRSAFSGQPDPAVIDAYNRARQEALRNQQAAQEQHPSAYVGGQLAGALALPMGAAGGASTAARIGRATAAGAVGGGLYGLGSGISEGQSAPELALSTAQGAGAGTLFGAAGGLGAEGAGWLGSRIASLFRGGASAETEAARKVAAALRADAQATGRAIPFDPAALAAGDAAGIRPAIVDFGGGRTQSLFRSAANLSPEARQAAEEFTQARYHQQSARAGPYVRDLAGGMAAGDDVEAIKAAARAANKPLYDRAYQVGDRPIYSPKLDQLMSSRALPHAMASAVERGADRAALDGYGAFNPRVTVTPDGKVIFRKGAGGLPAYPNLQFWDYTQRELRDMATAAERAGRNEEAATLKGLHRELLNELDKQVPSFGDARGTAARFFGAADAWDAGAEFVRRNVDFRESARLLAKMRAPERELFARGFATRLADEIEKAPDPANVLDMAFLTSPAAKRKIQMALGPERKDQLEALLRAERLIDRARKALGGSTTARQWHELSMLGGHGVAGAGAVGGLEFLREDHVEPAHVLAGALLFGAARYGARKIDHRVAEHVGRLLLSSNTQDLARGLRIVTKNPTLFNALRQATSAGARVGAHDIGARKAAAGAVALMESGLGNEQPGHGHDALVDQLP